MHNSHLYALAGTTPFNLTITRPPSYPILDRHSTIAPTEEDSITPSSRIMRVRILKRLAAMFDEAGSRSTLARATYKRYMDGLLKHIPIFKEGNFNFIQRPPTEAKSKGKDENSSHYNLWYRMTGPYKVLSSTTETVTVYHDGDPCLYLTTNVCLTDDEQSTKITYKTKLMSFSYISTIKVKPKMTHASRLTTHTIE